MKRTTLLTLALLLPAGLIAGFLTFQAHRPSAWQLELDKYVELQDTLLTGTTTVRFSVRASKPWNFTPDLSDAVYGDTPYYRTDYAYSGEKNRGGPRALPYPPQNVWCALLEREGQVADHLAGETTQTVVFVAEHQDLYNADVLVHEAAVDLSAEALTQRLSQLGCEPLLEQVASLGH